jgi:hypothetical protein
MASRPTNGPDACTRTLTAPHVIIIRPSLPSSKGQIPLSLRRCTDYYPVQGLISFRDLDMDIDLRETSNHIAG